MSRRIKASMAPLLACLAVVGIGRGLQGESGENAIPVSLIQLIATPERFDGKLVGVIGFCNLEFEGDALYLHREDFESSLLRNAVALQVPPSLRAQRKELSGQYVIVEGRFEAPEPGGANIWAGYLEGVRRLERCPSRADMERMTAKDNAAAEERRRSRRSQ